MEKNEKDRRMIISAMPFPDDVEKAGFYAIVYGRLPDAKAGDIHVLYMLFKDEEHGRKVFDIIRSWNEYKTTDFEENIMLSFVDEENGGYSAYIYKNPKKIVRKADKEDKAFSENLIMQTVFCRNFALTARKSFDIFKKTYKIGQVFLFSGAVMNGDKIKTFDDMTIEKNELYFYNRKTLDKNSFEYKIEEKKLIQK